MCGKSEKCKYLNINGLLALAVVLSFFSWDHTACSQPPPDNDSIRRKLSSMDYPIIESNYGIIEIRIGSAYFRIDSYRKTDIELPGKLVIRILSGCRGNLRYNPPDKVEIQQLEMYTGESLLDGTFDKGNVIFMAENNGSDTPPFSYGDLIKAVDNKPLNPLVDEFYERTGRNIIIDMMQDILSPEPGRFFYSDIESDEAGHLAFCLSGDGFSLYKFGMYRLRKIGDIVNDYRLDADMDSLAVGSSYLSDIGFVACDPASRDNAHIIRHADITRYVIDSRIGNTGKMSVNCRIYFSAPVEDCRFLRFKWSEKNEIISILNSAGDSLEFISRPDRGNIIWRGRLENEIGVILNGRSTPFEEDYIDIKYNCGVFTNYYGNFVPEVKVNTYPFKSVKHPEMFNMNMFSTGYFWNIFAEKKEAPWWDHIAGDSIYNLYEKYLERTRIVDEFFEFDIENAVFDEDFGAKKIHGKMPKFSLPYENIFLDARAGWYPRPYFRDCAAFDLNFECPAEYRVVSCGSRIFEDIGDGKARSGWVVEDSVRGVDFAVGNYLSRERSGDGIPFVETFVTKNFRFNELEDIYARMGRLSYSDRAGFVCAVVSECCDYYTGILGECDIDTLRVVSSCLNGHGSSSHGFIVIPWEKFQFEDFDCRSRMFIGHQVAHQWWGELVRSADYKDDWIMEGLSEYCAYMYTERLCENRSAVKELMDDMKTAVENGSGMYSRGSTAGSMTLGKRLLSSESDDFYPVVYARAAYIFHMIRYMLYDYKTESDEPFSHFLQDLIRSYRGKNISTGELRLLLQKHAGIDMAWFFDQWVYGTSIPKYKFEYETRPDSSGMRKVKCLIMQERVPDDFKMIVPFTVLFDEDKYIHVRFWIDKPVNAIEFPPLPYKPRKVIFNTYDAVLRR